MDKEMVKEHAQWRQPEFTEKIDTQPCRAPGAPLLVDGGARFYLRGLLESATVFRDRG